MIDVKTALLFDFYGQLLTDKQQEVMHLYFEDDCSLREIAEELQVSRQAVHDMIKKSRKALDDYEEKMGLAGRFVQQDEAVKQIEAITDGLIRQAREPAKESGILPEGEIRLKREDLLAKLTEIKTIISNMEQEIINGI